MEIVLTPDRYLGNNIWLITFVDTNRGELWLELAEVHAHSEPDTIAHYMAKLTKDVFYEKTKKLDLWHEIKRWVKENVSFELGEEDYRWFEQLLEFFRVMFLYNPPNSWRVG